jgi:hypothetical protein
LKDFSTNDHVIVVNPSSNTNASSNRYFCSYCNTRLVPLTQEDKIGGYLCTKCTIEYWPKQTPVKKADKFDLPGPDIDSHGNIVGEKKIPIAVIDVREASSTAYKQPKLPAAYEALSKKGFKFTNFEER